jgi:hypothetical protein
LNALPPQKIRIGFTKLKEQIPICVEHFDMDKTEIYQCTSLGVNEAKEYWQRLLHTIKKGESLFLKPKRDFADQCISIKRKARCFGTKHRNANYIL